MTGARGVAALATGASAATCSSGGGDVPGVVIADSVLGVAEIGRMDFRTSRSGETATRSLLRALGLQYRYQPARLAIGRSLGIATRPAAVDNLDGKVIRGETLFGQGASDLGLWAGLVEEHAGVSLDRRSLHDLVAAHWARGAGLLWDALRDAPDPLVGVARLASRAR